MYTHSNTPLLFQVKQSVSLGRSSYSESECVGKREKNPRCHYLRAVRGALPVSGGSFPGVPVLVSGLPVATVKIQTGKRKTVTRWGLIREPGERRTKKVHSHSPPHLFPPFSGRYSQSRVTGDGAMERAECSCFQNERDLVLWLPYLVSAYWPVSSNGGARCGLDETIKKERKKELKNRNECLVVFALCKL